MAGHLGYQGVGGRITTTGNGETHCVKLAEDTVQYRTVTLSA